METARSRGRRRDGRGRYRERGRRADEEKTRRATGGPELEQKGRDEQMKGNLETSATKAKETLKKGV
jgi:hypothetical protein